MRPIIVGAAAAMLAAATVAVFLFFDAHSHSNSDTLRPFILTMAPAWIAFWLGCRLVPGRRHPN